jgi:hypothetical protein
MATKITIQIGPISAPALILTATRDETESELKTVCVGHGDVSHGAGRGRWCRRSDRHDLGTEA